MVYNPIFNQINVPLERKSVGVPPWLDADFLYRINYGPASPSDAAIAWEGIKGTVGGWTQQRITLLDRRIVYKLFEALFNTSVKPPILRSDWNEEEEAEEEEDADQICSSEGLLSPFDYRYFNSETLPYFWCE